jgi:putative oxygen-independent coproporphyrinogen III oxidase
LINNRGTTALNTLIQKPPLGLYIHIPWCVRKCPYCDFNSHELRDELDESAYVDALARDLSVDVAASGKRKITSIFFGGGTPSLLSADAVHAILQAVSKQLDFEPDIEITLEANPGTFEQQRFRDYRAAGVNRLSIGVQSFNDASLQRIGRIHDARQARTAVIMAVDAGFDNINLDLMFGLPGQSLKDAIEDVRTACELQPSHISHYQLTIEPNTLFYSQTPALPAADPLWNMQARCHEMLASKGYAQYEISAFAQPDRQCRHNLNYWRFGDYIGIGAGAHGKITDTDGNRIQRRWKYRQPIAYVEASRSGEFMSGESSLDETDRLFEFLLNALRLREGFSFSLFEQRTGLSRGTLLDACARVRPGLLEINPDGVSCTPLGYGFLNDVLETFLD